MAGLNSKNVIFVPVRRINATRNADGEEAGAQPRRIHSRRTADGGWRTSGRHVRTRRTAQRPHFKGRIGSEAETATEARSCDFGHDMGSGCAACACQYTPRTGAATRCGEGGRRGR